MSLDPFAVAPVMGLLRATPDTGVALINGTQTILSWTAPDDGQMHRVIVASVIHVTIAETGGQVQLIFSPVPGGTQHFSVLFNAGLGTDAGGQVFAPFFVPVVAGTTVQVTQTSALSPGAATVWAELWGS